MFCKILRIFEKKNDIVFDYGKTCLIFCENELNQQE